MDRGSCRLITKFEELTLPMSVERDPDVHMRSLTGSFETALSCWKLQSTLFRQHSEIMAGSPSVSFQTARLQLPLEGSSCSVITRRSPSTHEHEEFAWGSVDGQTILRFYKKPARYSMNTAWVMGSTCIAFGCGDG